MAFSKAKNLLPGFKIRRRSYACMSFRGFTLIELMIVVAIIGILAGVAVPRYRDLVKRSKEGATKGNLGALRSALNIYYSDNEYFPEIIAINPGSPNWLHTADGYGWQTHDDFKYSLYDIPECTIGPAPGGSIPTRNTVYHLGLQLSLAAPTPANNDVGWWYYRSTDTMSGLTTVAKIYINVKGFDHKSEYYTSW